MRKMVQGTHYLLWSMWYQMGSADLGHGACLLQWPSATECYEGRRSVAQPGATTLAWTPKAEIAAKTWRCGQEGKQDGGPADSGKGKTVTSSSPQVPRVEVLPAPPAVPNIQNPKRGAGDTTGAVSSDRAQLEALLASLSGATSLPEAAQAMVTEFQRSVSKNTARDLHRVVTEQAKARQEPASLRGQRTAYLAAWQQYVSEVVEMVDKQIKEQSSILEAFSNSEIAWAQQESQASQALARLARQDDSAVEVISDGMEADELAEDKVNEAIEIEQRVKREQEAQVQASSQILQALQAVKQQADEQASKDREGSRTPRRKSNEGESEVAKLPPAALTPFKLGMQGASKAGAPSKDGTHPPQAHA